MRKYYIYLVISLAVVLSACVSVYALRGNKVVIEQYSSSGRVAKIHPDYCETVVPPNIAPLNFLVQEEGSYYCVKIYSKQGKPIEVFSRTPKIVIPENPWHELLNMNRGHELCFDIYVRNQANQWTRFETITNRIANEDIDNYLVYRKIHPVHSAWKEMGIYQRNLRNYDESPVLDNEYFQFGCLNCHTFCNNRTDKMLIGIRSSIYGSSVALLAEDGVVNKIGLGSAYTSWHPSGRLAAYSVNKVRQFFHSATKEVRDVVDLDSLLAYYIVDSKTVKTSPNISRKDRLETYPAWSADGRYLYFCSAPILWSDRNTVPPEHYEQVRYDLMRISYDIDRDQWGELETILSAQDTGLSILLPRPSPDGRWLLFVMCNYGCFPVYQPSSDLYIMDLKAAEQTGQYQYRRLEINSDQSESWHSWSSNSRWIAFSSKKETGLFTRTYLSYVDEQGKVYKPLLLPQKDPAFYDSCLKTYSVPELVTGAVQVTGEKLARAIRGSRQVQVEMPITMATPKAGEAPGAEPWLGDHE
jgi:hypothetical protein